MCVQRIHIFCLIVAIFNQSFFADVCALEPSRSHTRIIGVDSVVKQSPLCILFKQISQHFLL